LNAPDFFPFCSFVPAWMTRQRMAPMVAKRVERRQQVELAAARAKTARTLVVKRPCRGRLVLHCQNGPGCEGHMVRILVLRPA